ncbi:MAG: undecaprenyl/decaprenyl-phosphate alpha-N-acetylglucosaminyl 1-phosphate transferase [Actinobacteria bacterium HGW-Actinobacteria-5]|nr:MAG: undecaprenyl/decaprenyl-phosphate alpha-N-acetylglucosaminyl 1-phosphate transferase [Actinobacteria bacterium HGW-Actinobacteria-5]
MALVLRGGDFGTATFAPPLIVAFAICHFTGLFDDFHELRARWKLLLQSLAAIILVVAGFRFRMIPLPGNLVDLGYLSYPLSFLWIVGVSNAINMIDGMDGLAGGLVAIAAFTYGIVYTSVGNSAAAITAFILAGAVLGFLFHNYPPAKIFMGDSGSLFLGIAIATLPLLGRGAYSESSGLFVGITLVLIPVFDVFAAILRRLRRGVSVMSPDKEHLHHKVMSLGFEQRTVLLMIYAVDLLLSCLVLSGLILPYRIFFSLLVLSWFITVLSFIWLHFATNPEQRHDDYCAKKNSGPKRKGAEDKP